MKTDWVLPPHKNTSTVAGAGSKIQCTVCKKRFFSGSGLRRHCLNKHNNLSNSKCDPHPRDVKTNLVLPSHKNTVTGSKLYCKICKKRFFSLSGLRRHRQNKHNNLRDREPPVPDTKHNVKLHSIKDEVMTQKKHLNTEYNQCEKCGIRFSSKSNLRRHRLNKHNLIILNRSESVELPKPNVKSHGKLYLSKDEEETYKKSHSNLVTIVTESPVAMERESSVTIVTESQVAMERESSVTMVTGGHQCEHCGKCFRKKNNLTRHIKIHMGLQFRCKYCSRTYSSSSSLCKHKRSHRKAADSLMCSYCEYTCFRSDIMKEHIEGVHEKIRKYRCEICSKDFVYRSEFYKHKAKHHVMLPSAKF